MLSFFKKWIKGLKEGPVDWDEFEATLIQSDLGHELTGELIQKMKKERQTALSLQSAVEKELSTLWEKSALEPEVTTKGFHVWLVIGVNGVGKTTTVARLAKKMQLAGHKVHLVAGDTFRAAAIDQLRLWAQKLNCGFTAGREGGDPAAAAYEGVASAKAEGASLVLIDTSGRLHNKDNLMRELLKTKRVIGKQDAILPQETILVVDATNGSNALSQAREFHEHIGVSRVIITKLDSSAKGGVVAAIKRELNLDTWLVGVGESENDLIPFSALGYVRRFFGEEEPEPVEEAAAEEKTPAPILEKEKQAAFVAAVPTSVEKKAETPGIHPTETATPADEKPKKSSFFRWRW